MVKNVTEQSCSKTAQRHRLYVPFQGVFSCTLDCMRFTISHGIPLSVISRTKNEKYETFYSRNPEKKESFLISFTVTDKKEQNDRKVLEHRNSYNILTYTISLFFIGSWCFHWEEIYSPSCQSHRNKYGKKFAIPPFLLYWCRNAVCENIIVFNMLYNFPIDSSSFLFSVSHSSAQMHGNKLKSPRTDWNWK